MPEVSCTADIAEEDLTAATLGELVTERSDGW